MMYKRKSFTVPASTADGSLCREKGRHSAHDSRGRCLCCGAKVVALAIAGGPLDGDVVVENNAIVLPFESTSS